MPFAVRSCATASAASAGSLAAQTAAALRSVFGARVTISSTGALAMPRDVAELAVTEQELVVDSRHDRALAAGWFNAGLGLRCVHRAKLGIDLAAVRGRLDLSRRLLVIELPPCRLLSLETVSAEKTAQDDWFLNRATPADFAAALAANTRAAREQASRQEVPRAADESLERRLREALRPLGLKVEVRRGEGQGARGETKGQEHVR